MRKGERDKRTVAREVEVWGLWDTDEDEWEGGGRNFYGTRYFVFSCSAARRAAAWSNRSLVAHRGRYVARRVGILRVDEAAKKEPKP